MFASGALVKNLVRLGAKKPTEEQVRRCRTKAGRKSIKEARRRSRRKVWK